MPYRYWYFYSEDVTVHNLQLASLAIYDVLAMYETQLARYYFKAGDGQQTNVVIIPIRPVSIDLLKEEAEAVGDMLAKILTKEKANKFVSNLQRTTITLWQLGTELLAIPSHWQPDQQDDTANLQIPALTSKVPLTKEDLATIAADAERYLYTPVRIPVANVYPVTSSPASIVAIPREDIDKGEYYQEFAYELNLFLDEAYRTHIITQRITVTDGRFIDATKIADVLEKAGLIKSGTIEASTSQQQQQQGTSGGTSGTGGGGQ